MKSTAATKIKLGNKYPREAMTTAEKQIELDAKRRSLQSIQVVMQEAHKFPLEKVGGWWKEARKLVSEIEKCEQQLEDEKGAEQ